MCARVVALGILAPGRGGIDRPVRRPLRHISLCGRRWRAARGLVCRGQECKAVGAPRGARKHWVHSVLPLRAPPPIEGRRRRGPWGAGGIHLLHLLLPMLQQLMRGAGRAAPPANHAPFPPREVAAPLKASSQPQRARSSSTALARPRLCPLCAPAHPCGFCSHRAAIPGSLRGCEQAMEFPPASNGLPGHQGPPQDDDDYSSDLFKSDEFRRAPRGAGWAASDCRCACIRALHPRRPSRRPSTAARAPGSAPRSARAPRLTAPPPHLPNPSPQAVVSGRSPRACQHRTPAPGAAWRAAQAPGPPAVPPPRGRHWLFRCLAGPAAAPAPDLPHFPSRPLQVHEGAGQHCWLRGGAQGCWAVIWR